MTFLLPLTLPREFFFFNTSSHLHPYWPVFIQLPSLLLFPPITAGPGECSHTAAHSFRDINQSWGTKRLERCLLCPSPPHTETLSSAPHKNCYQPSLSPLGHPAPRPPDPPKFKFLIPTLKTRAGKHFLQEGEKTDLIQIAYKADRANNVGVI